MYRASCDLIACRRSPTSIEPKRLSSRSPRSLPTTRILGTNLKDLDFTIYAGNHELTRRDRSEMPGQADLASDGHNTKAIRFARASLDPVCEGATHRTESDTLQGLLARLIVAQTLR